MDHKLSTTHIKSELNDAFEQISFKGAVNDNMGLNAHVKSINTEQFARVSHVVTEYGVKVALKRSGTGISICLYTM